MITKKGRYVKPFYLLKAPWLVWEAVIQHMDPLDIMPLVQCSKRMRSIVKSFTKRQHYRLHLKPTPNFVISLKSIHSYDKFNFMFTEDLFHRCLGYKGVWNINRPIHLSDKVFLMKQLFYKLQSLYTLTFELVEFDLNDWKNNDPSLVYNWLNTFGDKIQRARIHSNCISGVGYQRFLENFHFSNYAILTVTCPDFDWLEGAPLPLFHDHLRMKPANWVTEEYLLSLKNSVTVVLEEAAMLTDENINSILHNLIRGSNPRLEYIKLGLDRNYDGWRILEGIEVYHEDSGRVFRRNRIEQFDEGGYYFQLDSGENATIFFYPDDVSIGVVIWRNENN